MRVRTVRLDEEAERALMQIATITGLSVSEAVKKGLLTLRNDVFRAARRAPYDIYKELDLGPGGDAVAPATQTRPGRSLGDSTKATEDFLTRESGFRPTT